MSSRVINSQDLESAGFSTLLEEWTDTKFGGELLSVALENATGDVTAIFNAALTRMNTNKRPLIIDRSISISGANTVTGYCVIHCTEDSWINITGGSQGIRAENTYTDVGAWTAVPTLVTSPDSTGSVVTAFTVDTASFAALSVGDTVYIKDNVTNTFTYNGTNDCGLAEICSIIEKRGSDTIVLSRVIGDMAMYSAAGRIYKIDNNPCDLKLNIRGEKVTPRSAVRVQGYVFPKFDIEVDGNSAAGLFVVSCLGGGGKVRARDLINDPTNNRYGYGVVTYGACYGMHFDIRALRCRHAFTDGILAFAGMSSGIARNNTVTGVAIDCSAASWDTHPNSDGQRFVNIAAWGTNNSTTQSSSGLNQAVQIRGTNVSVDGLQTNIRKGVMYTVNAVRDSHTRVRGIKQDTVVSGTPSTLNGQYSIGFLTRGGTGVHKFTMSDCPLVHALNYANGLV